VNNLSFHKEIEGYSFRVFNEKPNFEVIQVDQVHGSIVLSDKKIASSKNEADGLYSLDLEVPLAIKTADCLPIFILGKKGVSLLHAGWRGVHQKIVLTPEVKQITPYHFFIGPFIQAKHFQVQDDFRQNFPKSEHFKQIEGKLYFDLGRETADQIKSSYPEAKTEISPISTFDDENFHSYRRNGTLQRNWNVLSKIK
jgi:copper oxidase (laccase) domain-containing protein